MGKTKHLTKIFLPMFGIVTAKPERTLPIKNFLKSVVPIYIGYSTAICKPLRAKMNCAINLTTQFIFSTAFCCLKGESIII